ncbi:12184_t:CDS:2, partial [Acaulospora colombiana]
APRLPWASPVATLAHTATPMILEGHYSMYSDRPDTPKDLPMLPDGIFLSTNLTAPPEVQDEFQDLRGPDSKQEYGYLGSEKHVILGLDEVVRLVDVVAEELGQRGLTTPLLFSPLAIDIRPNVVKKLISTFIATCPHHLVLSSTEARWREEATFAGPHELGMLLRWGLARIVRLEKGIEMRGFINWESYILWRQQEQ